MRQLTDTLLAEVAQHAARLLQLPETVRSARPAPGKWSKKEVIGHLVDSAHNNIRRLVCGQYQDAPHIIYHQEEWVGLQHYQEYDSVELLNLWVALNRHLAHILRQMPERNYERLCDMGKNSPELQPLRWVAEDYVRHLRHHLAQTL